MNDFIDLMGEYSGLVIGIIGIVIAIFTWMKSRRKKSLAYEVISDVSILEIEILEDQIKQHLRVFYDEKRSKIFLC